MAEVCRNGLAYFFRGIKDCLYGVIHVWQVDRKAAIEEESPQASTSPPPRRPLTVLEQRRAASTSPPPIIIQKKPKTKPKLSTLLLKGCLWNGILVVMVYLFFQYFVLPQTKTLTEFLFKLTGNTQHKAFWVWAEPVLSVVFQTFYFIPMFIISKINNTFLFQDIANEAWKVSKHRKRQPVFSVFIADLLYSIILQTIFLAQSCLSSLIPLPLIGTVMNQVHLSLLYSMYAYEYRWLNQGYSFNVRIDKLQNQWPYFVGFGLPLAYLTTLPDSVILSGALFAIGFPVMIVSAHEAPEIRQNFDVSLKIFCFVIRVSNFIFKKAPIVLSIFYVFIMAIYSFFKRVVRIFYVRPQATNPTS